MPNWELQDGLIHVYTGAGKGKTTAALGLALRALGWGARVCVVQFIKGYADIGEAHAAECFGDRLVLKQFASDAELAIDEEKVMLRREEAQAAMTFAEEAVTGGDYDLVILDEINNAMHYNLIPTERVVKLLESKPKRLELVLTGRNAPVEVVRRADYVTEMLAIKHPFAQRIDARRGIDY